jgi:hypothetical protein
MATRVLGGVRFRGGHLFIQIHIDN